MAARLTVCLSFDVDTVSIWLGADNATAVSRGEFGAVAVPRILDLLGRRGLQATFFVPGLTTEVYPDVTRSIVDAGHELAHHGWRHESPARLDGEGERAVLEKGIEILESLTGTAPVGWRSPAWYTSERSIPLLIEHGFLYDSSMMGHDVRPYFARVGDRWGTDIGFEFGTTTGLVEMPVHWSLDDFPYFEYLPPRGGGMRPVSDLEEVWMGDFEWAYEHEPGGVLTLTMHPQVIGRGHRLLALERMVDRMRDRDGVEFTTMEAAARAWKAAQDVQPGQPELETSRPG